MEKPRKKKYWLWGLGVVLVLIILALLYVFGTQWFEKYHYDLNHHNKYVSKKEQIAAILMEFKRVNVNKLPKSILKRSKLLKPEYASITQNQSFYLITKRDVYRKIVGNTRILDMYSSDLALYTTSYFSDDTLYWGIDERILYKLLLLQDKLESKGYDRDAIEVRYGHRSPLMNELVNGASQSRHIAGQAVDMVIGDIDKNSKFTDADKQIVIDICEKYIIKNEGGLGLYPGTRTVHMDVRGYRARWNNYKGKFFK
jgi:Peptidase M15